MFRKALEGKYAIPAYNFNNILSPFLKRPAESAGHRGALMGLSSF
jgi:hypothetical protein